MTTPRHRATILALSTAALLTAAAVTSATPPAHAQSADLADEADALFALGNAAYVAGKFDEALVHYHASNRLAPNRNVILNIALCYEQLSQYVAAYRYYDLYASSGTLDASEKQLIEDAFARVAPYVSRLRVETDPPGATLYINRRDLGSRGTTPRELGLPPDTYTIILERSGYLPYEQTGVATTLGDETVITIELEQILGRLELSGTPSGAALEITLEDGETLSSTLPFSQELPPGAHDVVINADGYVSQRMRLRVDQNATTEAEIELQRETGTLVVQSDERDALILIDGNPAGFTPSVLDNLPTGEHTLEVASDGFKTYQTTVDILTDQRVLIDVSLAVEEDVAAASRSAEAISDAPASISLIGKREIQAFGYTDLADAVIGTRGFYYNFDGTYSSLGVRGFSPFGQFGNRLLVLLDGHSTNEEWIGSSFIEFGLLGTLEEVERIEIVRGPGSPLYGTGAFFGVINLVTRDDVQDFGVRVGTTVLDDGTVRAHGGIRTPIGEDGGVWLTGSYIQSQPREFAFDAFVGSAEAPDGTVTGGELVAGSIHGKVWWRDLTLQGYFNDRQKQVPTASYETIIGDDRTHEDDRRAFLELRYAPQLTETLALRSRVFYDYYAYEGAFAYEAPDLVYNEVYEGHGFGADAGLNWRPTDAYSVGGGVEYQAHPLNQATGDCCEPFEVYLDEAIPFHLISSYLNASGRFVDWFELSANLRFDGYLMQNLPKLDDATGGILFDANDEIVRESRFFSDLNYRFALNFKPADDATIKLMGGSAFRAPSVYELTYNDAGATQIPSPGLEPEKIYTAELEYTQRFASAYVATLSTFFNAITNPIEQRGEGDDVEPLFFVNNGSDSFLTLGVEAELRREFRSGWMFNLQYAYQRTRLNDPFSGERVPNSPEHIASAKVVAPLYGKILRIASRFTVEALRLDRDLDDGDPVLLWDLVFSGEAPTAGLRYSIGVRNLLGWDYGLPVGEELGDSTFLQQGRTFVVDVAVEF